MLIGTAVLLTGCGSRKQAVFTETVYADESESSASGASTREFTDREVTGSSKICVFVCGAVVREGVYYLPEGSRVIDAVNAAGGYSEDADRIYVNQAEFVYDAQRVEIPTIEEAREYREMEKSLRENSAENESGGSDGKININTAGRSELMEIPGIGESKADRILSYREAHGRFTSPEEIMNVSGIGEAVYENMKDHITVE